MFLKKSLMGSVLVVFVMLMTGCESLWEYDDQEAYIPPPAPPVVNPQPFVETGVWGKEEILPVDDWTPLQNVNPTVILFAYDRDIIGSQEETKLKAMFQYLQQNTQIGLIIEGHCDERGSVEYNRVLGEKRALSVKEYLVNNGISETRFKTISFGEDTPVDRTGTESGHAQNRRAVLKPARMR